MRDNNTVHDNSFLIKLLIILCLILITYTVFSSVINHGFIALDDDMYVTGNPHVQRGLSLKGIFWAFTSTGESGMWIPLTWLSLMLDAHLYGLNPGGFHLTNLLLHIINVLLLFIVLARITGCPWKSAFVAALFAIHPLRVESVAWVTERKDVLSALFFLLSLWIYADYVENPNMKRYVLVFLFFVFGIMAKPSLIVFPFVLLLLDYWPFARFQEKKSHWMNGFRSQEPSVPEPKRSHFIYLIIEKVPFLLFAPISGIVTLLGHQNVGALSSLKHLPISIRISCAFVFYVKYIGKMFWPRNLAIFYPHPYTFPIEQVMGAMVFLLSVSLLVIWKARKRYLVFGWFWYLVALLPVIGILQAGVQGIADRFTYLPLIGLFVMIAWGVPDILSGWRYRQVVLSVSAILVLATLMISSRLQVGLWQDSKKIFEHTLLVTENNFLIHHNFGHTLAMEGRIDEGISHLRESLRIRPDRAKAHYHLGLLLVDDGRIEEGIACYREALRVNPDFEPAHNNLGAVLARRGKTEDAIFHYTEALRIKPDFASAHINLGMLRAKEGNFKEAIEHYSKVLRLRPHFSKAWFHLGLAYLEIGDRRRAVDAYNALKGINRDLANILFNRIYE